VRKTRVSPIRPPGTLAGRHDELREALTECKATMQSYTAALSRIIER
jgi:hypothetical protein